MRVLKPKVDGTCFLDEILPMIRLTSSFSSHPSPASLATVASNYAAANLYLSSLAAQRRQRGVAANVIDIGAIMGIGYMAREVSDNVLAQCISAEYRKRSERLPARVRECFGSGQPEELITGLHVVAPEEDFKPAWCENPRFSHVVRSAASKAGHAVGMSTAAISPKELLKQGDAQDQVVQIVQGKIVDVHER